MTFSTTLVCSKSQPDVDPTGSKHVAVRIFYKVLFDLFLFILYFIVTHSGTHNFQ